MWRKLKRYKKISVLKLRRKVRKINKWTDLRGGEESGKGGGEWGTAGGERGRG